MNFEFLHTEKFHCEALIRFNSCESDDLLLYLCKNCGHRFSCKRGVLYGGVYDLARARRLRVRCPSYVCQAKEYIQKRKAEGI